MNKRFAAILLVVGLVIASLAQGEIFKWVDEEGNVHFGDCPSADCGAAAVPMVPAPSAEAVREAQRRAEELQDYQRELSEGRNRRAAEAARVDGVIPSTNIPVDVPCFRSLSDTWGDLIPDVRGNVNRRTLKDTEYDWLEGLLRSLEGRREGIIHETVCIRPDASPPRKLKRYEVDWHGHWQSDREFRIRADLQGLETGIVDVEYLNFLLSRNGLRFRKMVTDIFFQLDLPGNDAEVVELERDRMTFFWRRDSNVRRTTVVSLRKVGRDSAVSEFFYVQGVLTGKRHWEIDR